MFRLAALALAALTWAASAPAAIVVTVNAAGSTSANLSGYTFGVANLDNVSNGPTSFNFVGSPITGTTMDGYINIGSANVYGGAVGSGQFASLYGDPATIQLSQSVNYFGLWGSALDGNNSVALYNDNTLLGTYALQSVLQAIRASTAAIMAIRPAAAMQANSTPSSTSPATAPSTASS